MRQGNRRSVRLSGYDYSSPGAYFVTIVAFKRELLFGKIKNDEIHLKPRGKIVSDCWQEIPKHFPHVELGAFVVMPNHVHGVIVINEDISAVRATHASPLQNKPGPVPGSLGAVIGSFKSAATKRTNKEYDSPGLPLWQRNYYEHIIRDDRDWQRIHNYIIANPVNWKDDEENQAWQ